MNKYAIEGRDYVIYDPISRPFWDLKQTTGKKIYSLRPVKFAVNIEHKFKKKL